MENYKPFNIWKINKNWPKKNVEIVLTLIIIMLIQTQWKIHYSLLNIQIQTLVPVLTGFYCNYIISTVS